MSDIQKQVQQALDRLVESGTERGLQVSVYRHGEPVVEAVAGVADAATGRPVTPGTVFYNFSIGKAATSAVVHVLAERGVLGYDTPVVEVWPEFGAHGKDKVTVRHVLNHSAGVPGVPLDTSVEDICDWDKMCTAVADAEPWWEPGTKTGYHAYTFGYIAGEIVRRVTGKPISQVLREDITVPLSVDGELYFGMPESEHGRLATLEDPAPAGDAAAGDEWPEMPADSLMFRAGPMELFPNAAFGNRTDVLAADIPAGGKTSARATARMLAAMMDEVDGVRLISPERLREVTTVSISGIDEVFGNPATWGLGYALGLPVAPSLDSPTAFGMGGVGGSFAFGDPSTGVAFAVTKNMVSGDFATATELVTLVRKALGEVSHSGHSRA
ncbi:serine hydrolase domain-containing protein [Actinomadura rudentiformis]|uniref:Beta-lactamase family protein n=1 Tax=Actinomadura rudentiformis TaxID=359158 RepID=A0A6H9YAR7_9ACTN|nr:serine hydrolase domain-containing protein [Actinomadura rudentiformis]KAB2340988.1 beta-lactamase family protein [Actinomadura rudentiformis]